MDGDGLEVCLLAWFQLLDQGKPIYDSTPPSSLKQSELEGIFMIKYSE
jgi:hypothetical protein